MDLVTVHTVVGAGPHTICSNCDGQEKTVKSQYPSAVLPCFFFIWGLRMNKYNTNIFYISFVKT